MANLDGLAIKDSYGKLLITSDAGITATPTQVITGDGDASKLYLSTAKVGINSNAPGKMLEISDSSEQLRLKNSSDYSDFYLTASSLKLIVPSGDIHLDASGDVILDADGDQVSMKFGGATGQIDFSNENSGDGIIRQMINAKDLVFQQYDGSEVVRIGDDRKLYFYDKGGEHISSDGTNMTIASGGDIILDADDDIEINANGADIAFKDDSATFLTLTNSSTDALFKDTGGTEIFRIDASENSVLMASTNKIQFGDTGTYIHQSADGVLDLVSDTELELNATTIDINGAVDISGALTVGGNIDFNSGTIDLSTQATTIEVNQAVGGLAFDGQSDNILSIDASNNRIGIGDGTPSYTLDVNGTARFTGNVGLDTMGGLIVAEQVWVPSTKEIIQFSSSEAWEFVSDKAKLTWTQPANSTHICIEVSLLMAGTNNDESESLYIGLVGGVSSATGSGPSESWTDYPSGGANLNNVAVTVADVFDEGDSTNNGRMSSHRVFQTELGDEAGGANDTMIYASFYYTGLTAGTSYTVLLASKANAARTYQILVGCEQNMSNSAENYAPLVMRARTLPTSFSTVTTASN